MSEITHGSTLTVNIPDAAAGIYFIRLTDKNEDVIRKFLVRQVYFAPLYKIVAKGLRPVLHFFDGHSTLVAHTVHVQHINSCGLFFFSGLMLFGNNSNQKESIDKYDAQPNKKHNAICHLLRLCLMAMANPKMVMGQSPTQMPSSSLPVNQRYTEQTKLRKAKIIG